MYAPVSVFSTGGFTAVYHMLRDGTDYRDLGPVHLSRRDSDRVAARLARRIRELGYEVDIRAAAA